MHTQGSWVFAISPACSWRRRIADNWETLRVAFLTIDNVELGSLFDRYWVIWIRAKTNSELLPEESWYRSRDCVALC